MLRFFFVITVSIIPIIFFIAKCHYIERHPEKYTEEARYETALYACNIIEKRSFIKTDIYGVENLPKEGGYIMYPNHQGKFDTIGIMLGHKKPCSVVIDAKKKNTILLKEYISVVQGKWLDRTDMKNQVKVIMDMASDVKEGKKYIIFPEGGYTSDGTNDVHEFLPGAFKASIKAKAPIVPVALVNCFKPYIYNSLRRVNVQVHFLEPIYYDEYKDMKSAEIASLVKARIEKKISDSI